MKICVVSFLYYQILFISFLNCQKNQNFVLIIMKNDKFPSYVLSSFFSTILDHNLNPALPLLFDPISHILLTYIYILYFHITLLQHSSFPIFWFPSFLQQTFLLLSLLTPCLPSLKHTQIILTILSHLFHY